MTQYPAIDPPYRIDVLDASWLIGPDNVPVPIVRRSRRTVTIDRAGTHIELKRRRLEHAGAASGPDGTIYRVTTYFREIER